jgi:hypothetical protein
VEVDVIAKHLVPGVEDGGEADFSRQAALGIGAELVKGVGHGFEEDVEDGSLVAQGEWIELVGKSEDGVVILDGEEFGPARFEPLGFR